MEGLEIHSSKWNTGMVYFHARMTDIIIQSRSIIYIYVPDIHEGI